MNSYKTFIGNVVGGKVPEASCAELEALLQWLAGRRNKAAALIDAAFGIHGVPSDEAGAHVRDYLDSSLFKDETDYYRLFGLNPNSSLEAVRMRHKQLLQIFHPDRHLQHREWFTKRTEQLNKAYACLRLRHDEPDGEERGPRARSRPHSSWKQANNKARRPIAWSRTPSNASKLRRKLTAWLGSSNVFERRVYVAVFSVPALLMVVYATQRVDESSEHVKLSNGQVEPGAPTDMTDSKNRAQTTGNTVRGVSERANVVSLPETHPTTTSLALRRGVESSELHWLMKEHLLFVEDTSAHPKVGSGDLPIGPTPSGYTSREPTYSDSPTTYDIREIAQITPRVRVESFRRPGAEAVVETHRYETSGDVLREHIPGYNNVGDDRDQRTGDMSAYSHKGRIPDSKVANLQVDNPAFAGESETSIRDKEAVKVLLSQYQSAYKSSNVKRLARLFHPDAVFKDPNGRVQIIKRLLSVFEQTSARMLIIKEPSVRRLDDQRLQVTADYVLNWTYPDGTENGRSGRLDMNLVRVNDEMKIKGVEF